jgi:tetratricopeptide (TPR) repeat protein
VQAGKLAEGLAEAAAAFEAMPAGLDLATLLVPVLEKAGHQKEADALFERCLAVQLKLCRDYPGYAGCHNSVAWLSAACRRNLDEALKHAQKAVELAPESPGHLDTLAEVYFQRGDREKAVELERKVLQMAPQRVYFRKQLQRLEAGDPKAPLPPEDDEDDD